MSQHDYVIANGTGAAVRSDLNGALAAIVSNNSGATAPSTTYAYQWWADTTTGLLKLRNAANNAWITLFQLDGEWSTLAVENGSASAPSIYFKDSGTDTGIYSPGADQVAISTNGTQRLTVDTAATTSTLPVVHPLGAVGTPSITFTGDLNTGIWSPAADTIAFSEGGVEAMRIDSSGRVGIGTTSPAERFDVRRSGYGNVAFFADDSASGLFIKTASGAAGLDSRNNATALNFLIDGSEKARLDTSGRLLVGTSSTSSVSTVVLQGNSSSSTTQGIFRITRGEATPADGASLGTIVFGDSTHADTIYISGKRDGGTWSGSSKPSRLEFSTTADGASSPTERMRISQDGGTLWRSTGATSTHDLGNSNTSITGDVVTISGYRNTSNSTYNLLACVRQGFAVALYIRDSGNVQNANNSYTGISDIKLKENIADANSQWEDIKALKVRNYNFKKETGHPTHRQIGLIAQEVETVCPGLVDEAPDRDFDGNDLGTATKGVNYSVLYMKAVKALQEAMERIEVLEQRLTDAGIA